MTIKVIIPASGTGERFGGKIPKQFLKISGREIIAHSLEKFNKLSSVDEIIISTKLEYFVKISAIIKKYNLKKVKKIVEGGKRRQDSVYNALINLDCSKDDLIIIHDAVRPFISRNKIIELINKSSKENCVIPGLKISDTIKRASVSGIVEETIDRSNLWLIQTPQAFRFHVLKNSFDKANSENFTGTDESSIVENAGYKVKIIEGEKDNIKITKPEDLRKRK